MADGQPNNIGAIIQARMKSSRLPGKILMPLPVGNGKPIINWIVESLKQSTHINTIVVATSEEKEDDVFAEYVISQGFNLYRGSETDVLKRFAQAIDIYKLDTVIRLTSDNPIVAVKELDRLIVHHLSTNSDYTYCINMPLGMNIEIVKAKILTAINQRSDLTEPDREHVTTYVRNSTMYATHILPALQQSITDQIRLTVDYPADYAVLNIVAQLALQTGLTGMALVHYINKQMPWLWQVNNNSYQVKVFSNKEEELPVAVKKLRELGLFHTANLLENEEKK